MRWVWASIASVTTAGERGVEFCWARIEVRRLVREVEAAGVLIRALARSARSSSLSVL